MLLAEITVLHHGLTQLIWPICAAAFSILYCQSEAEQTRISPDISDDVPVKAT